jgi:hypothetical protein
MLLPSATTASSSATSEQTASSFPAACGAEAITYTRSAPRKEIHLPPNMLQLLITGGEKPQPRKLSRLQTRGGGDAEKVTEDTQDYNGDGALFQPHHSRHVLRGGVPRQDRGTATASVTSGVTSRHNGTQGPCGLTLTRTAENKSVSSGSKIQTVCLWIKC